MSSAMSWISNLIKGKGGQSTSDRVVVKNSLNPHAENVTYENVQIGCTNIYGADACLANSGINSPRGGKVSTSITKTEVADIRSSLKTFYEKITLPSLPWMESGYLPMQYYTKLQLKSGDKKSDSKIIELKNLLDAVNGKNPRRILVESQPGYGKTTLVHKIISDWVSEEDYVSRFKFAFLVILRNFKLNSLKNEVLQIINNETHDENEMWRIVNSEETLLILDGLDELSEKLRNDIFEILYDKKNEYKMTIITTCRTGLSRLTGSSMFGGVSIKSEFWCKKITILGIGTKNQDKFLRRFIDNNVRHKMMPRLHRIIKSLSYEEDEDEDEDEAADTVESEDEDDKEHSEEEEEDIEDEDDDDYDFDNIDDDDDEFGRGMFKSYDFDDDVFRRRMFKSYGFDNIDDDDDEFGRGMFKSYDFDDDVFRRGMFKSYGFDNIDDDDDEFGRGMFKSPLMLILLVYVTRSNHEIKIKTRTDLHKQFADYIIKRSIDKTGKEEMKVNFTLFDSSVNEYSSSYYKFGKMCWEHILKNKLQFKSNADTDAIHQMGFLLKHETKKKLETVIHYEGFHLSILEFAAAVFLTREFQNNQNRFNDQIITDIIKIFVAKEAASLITPFLCGLLGNNVICFFNQLSEHHFKYWMSQELMKPVLQECENNKSLTEYFTTVIPPYFTVDEVTVVVPLTDQYLGNHFAVLNIELEYLTNTTKQLYVREILRDTNHRTIFSQPLASLQDAKNISYESLQFDLWRDLGFDTLTTCLKIFVKITSEHKTLRLRHLRRMYTDLETSVCNGILSGVQFNLVVDVRMCDEAASAIAKIIEYNQVTNITIFFRDCSPTFTADILRLLAKSSKLNSASIFNADLDTVPLDLSILTENTKKKFDSLFLGNFKLQHNPTINSNRCIKSLSINAGQNCDVTRDASVVLSTTPSTLQCKDFALAILNNDKNASSWGGWDSVAKLVVTVYEGDYEKRFTAFSKFKNLRILTLELAKEYRCASVVRNILEGIRFLKLSRLEIRWLNEKYYEDVLRGVQNLIHKNEMSFVEDVRFVIVLDKLSFKLDDKFNLQPIKSALQSKFKICFCFLFYEWDSLHTFVKTNISDLLEFNFKYEFIANNMRNANYNLQWRTSALAGFHLLELELQ